MFPGERVQFFWGPVAGRVLLGAAATAAANSSVLTPRRRHGVFSRAERATATLGPTRQRAPNERWPGEPPAGSASHRPSTQFPPLCVPQGRQLTRVAVQVYAPKPIRRSISLGRELP